MCSNSNIIWLVSRSKCSLLIQRDSGTSWRVEALMIIRTFIHIPQSTLQMARYHFPSFAIGKQRAYTRSSCRLPIHHGQSWQQGLAAILFPLLAIWKAEAQKTKHLSGSFISLEVASASFHPKRCVSFYEA